MILLIEFDRKLKAAHVGGNMLKWLEMSYDWGKHRIE